MLEIKLNNIKLPVKDYYCNPCGDNFQEDSRYQYIKKDTATLWLYVNVTDSCNASCEFCVNHSNTHTAHSYVDPEHYSRTLQQILPYIHGVSFTGGEPMLNPQLLNTLIQETEQLVSDDVEIDLATNGTSLKQLVSLECFDRITSVHISRHSIDQNINDHLMHISSPTQDEIKEFLSMIKDPGKVVFNCVLQKGGVATLENVADYLDFAIETGISNTSFIGMFQANEYCRQHYVSPGNLPIVSDRGVLEWNQIHPDRQFYIWNRFGDYEYCHCLSGSYENKHGGTRFYFRCPGTVTPPDYCRQLVYTADNVLQDGFGEGRLRWIRLEHC